MLQNKLKYCNFVLALKHWRLYAPAVVVSNCHAGKRQIKHPLREIISQYQCAEAFPVPMTEPHFKDAAMIMYYQSPYPTPHVEVVQTSLNFKLCDNGDYVKWMGATPPASVVIASGGCAVIIPLHQINQSNIKKLANSTTCAGGAAWAL